MLLDALEALRSAAAKAPLYGKVDVHLNAAGHRVVAGFIAPELERLLENSMSRLQRLQ